MAQTPIGSCKSRVLAIGLGGKMQFNCAPLWLGEDSVEFQPWVGP